MFSKSKRHLGLHAQTSTDGSAISFKDSIGPNNGREVEEVVLELSHHGTQAERKYALTGL